MTNWLDALRARWGGGIRPSIAMHEGTIERWDGGGEGPGRSILFEGFGLTIWINIGLTPKEKGAGE